MTNYHYRRDPAPCQQIYQPQSKEQGFSILHNPRYPYYFILVPNLAMSGIESIALSREGRIDYFGYALANALSPDDGLWRRRS